MKRIVSLIVILFATTTASAFAKRAFASVQAGTALASKFGSFDARGTAPAISINGFAGYELTQKIRFGIFLDGTTLQCKTTVTSTTSGVPLPERKVTFVLASPCTAYGIRGEYAVLEQHGLSLYTGIFLGLAVTNQLDKGKYSGTRSGYPVTLRGTVVGLVGTLQKNINKKTFATLSVSPRFYNLGGDYNTTTLPVITAGAGWRL